MRIDLGNFSFNADEPDVNGTWWYVTDWSGWDSPPSRLQTSPPTGRHGAVLTQNMLDARTVLLTGVVKAQNEEKFWIAYNGLLGLLTAMWYPITLVVDEYLPKMMDVVRGNAPKLDLTGGSAFQFQAALLAPNPVKYNALTQNNVKVSGGQTKDVANAGTWETWPIITLDTDGSVDLQNQMTGGTLTLSGSHGAGTTIDTYRRTITNPYGGNAYRAFQYGSSWWAIQPGVSNTIVNNGTADVTLIYRDAYA